MIAKMAIISEDGGENRLYLSLLGVYFTVLNLVFSVSQTSCEESRVVFSCNFGHLTNETFCDMIQNQNDSFDWKLASTSSKPATGPLVDHTGQFKSQPGRFLWADSDDGHGGYTATIHTPSRNLTEDRGWLTFYYYMYGEKMGPLSVTVCEGGDSSFTIVGNQGRMWHEMNISVSCGNRSVKISFTAERNGATSDIAIDDIYLYDIFTRPTTPSTATSSPSTASPALSSSTLITDSSTGATSQPPPSSELVLTETLSSNDDITALSTNPVTDESDQTRSSPEPSEGPGLVLPLSLGIAAVIIVAVFFVIIVYLCQKRRKEPGKLPSLAPSNKYFNNHAYNFDNDTLRGQDYTMDRFNTSMRDSTQPEMIETSGTINPDDSSRQRERASQRLTSFSDASPNTDPESSYYFKLMSGDNRSSGIELNKEEANGYEPVNVKDDETGGYQCVDESSVAMATSGYEPVTVKDDETGGYQCVDELPGADDVDNQAGFQGHEGRGSANEPVGVRGNPRSKRGDVPPVPAERKNVPRKSGDKMVDNVLYNPMNNEKVVDNVLYNSLNE